MNDIPMRDRRFKKSLIRRQLAIAVLIVLCSQESGLLHYVTFMPTFLLGNGRHSRMAWCFGAMHRCPSEELKRSPLDAVQKVSPNQLKFLTLNQHQHKENLRSSRKVLQIANPPHDKSLILVRMHLKLIREENYYK